VLQADYKKVVDPHVGV